MRIADILLDGCFELLFYRQFCSLCLSPGMFTAIYFLLTKNRYNELPTNYRELLDTFIAGDSTFCSKRLKMIPTVVEGPWIVRKTVGSTPAILGAKLRQTCFCGEGYMEVGCF